MLWLTCATISSPYGFKLISDILHYQHIMSFNYQQLCNKPKLGTYLIDRTIGKGVFSVVKLGTHTITGIQVAMKIVDKTRLDTENLGKVRRESEILKRLHHPNVVRLFQVMETTKLLCMVMEYLPNGEVFDYIAVHGKITESEARLKFMEVLRAVHYIHSFGVVHRDLKAENLLFDANMNIKIVDFSFGARYEDLNNPPLLTTWCGSPPYAAPEIFQGEPYVGTKADIWSLGVVLYVMVCGTLPFDAQPLPLLKRQVLSGTFHVPQWLSHECENLMRSMLRKESFKRPTVERLMHHPWFHLSSSGNLQCSSFRTRCISDSGASAPSCLYPQQQQQTCLISAATSSMDGKNSPVSARARCTTSMVAQFDTELTLAADFEVGKFNELILFIMESYGLRKNQIVDSLSRNNYDHLTATYLLLGEKLNRREKGLLLRSTPLNMNRNSIDIQGDNISTPMASSDTSKPIRCDAKYSLDDSAVDVKCSYSHFESADSSFTTQSPSTSSPRTLEIVARKCLLNDLPCANQEGFNTCLNIDALDTAGHSMFYSSANPNIDEELSGRRLSHVTGASDQTNMPSLSFDTTTVDEKLPPRRNLTRRKYGIHFRDDALHQFTENILNEHVDPDRLSDSDISEDGAAITF